MYGPLPDLSEFVEPHQTNPILKEKMKKQNKPKKPMTYQAEKIIGNGSFGVVYKAINDQEMQQVAIKKVFQDKRYKNREL